MVYMAVGDEYPFNSSKVETIGFKAISQCINRGFAFDPGIDKGPWGLIDKIYVDDTWLSLSWGVLKANFNYLIDEQNLFSVTLLR
jgi:hypothetical protein